MRSRPHILFITDDQHRYDWLGWMGAPPRTPHLDRLRREGIWHRNVYSNNPLCMPARCSLLTGLYSHQSGQMNNDHDWPSNLRTLPQALQKSGYHTALIGKLHAMEGISKKIDLTLERDRIAQFGFDHVAEVSGKSFAWFIDCDWTHHLRNHGLLERYRAEISKQTPLDKAGAPFPFDESHFIDRFTGNRCVEWLENYDRQDPFFLWAGFCAPHPPYDAPEPWLQHHAPDTMPAPVDNPNPGNWPILRAHYAAMIELIDHEIGRLLATLERRGWLDETLVLFVSDHGEMLGDHGLDGKCWPHDPSIRVPCLARFPGVIRPGSVSDGLVSLIDLPVTCLAAVDVHNADAALPKTPGRSLMNHWKAPQSPFRRFIFSENGGQFNPAFRLLRTGGEKLVDWHAEGRISFYDLEADPSESRDLGGKPAFSSRQQALQKDLDDFLLSARDPEERSRLSFSQSVLAR